MVAAAAVMLIVMGTLMVAAAATVLVTMGSFVVTAASMLVTLVMAVVSFIRRFLFDGRITTACVMTLCIDVVFHWWFVLI